MKKGFPIKPLQSLCDDFKQDIVDGPFGSELQRKDYITEGIPVLKIQNVKPFAIALKRMDYVSTDKFHELRRHSFRRGDIVMTKLGSPLGVSAIVEDLDEGVIVADLVRVRAQRINTKYLCYHLNSQRTNDFINSMQKGTTRPRVTLSVVRELPIYAPPLAEQQRIVGLLDEAFEGLATAKANAEKNLQNARALFESHLQSVFTQRGPGWVAKRLDALAEFSQGIQVGLGDQSNAPAKGLVRFIRIIDYTQGTDDIRYVPDPGRRYWADKSDIVMVRYGTPGLVGRGIEGVIANNLFKISILDGSLTNDFLAYFLGQQTVQNYLSSQGSSTMPALTFTQLGAVVVSFPHELEEQNEIATKLDSLREETQRLARLYERKLAALEALKKSLLHQAFTGEL